MTGNPIETLSYFLLILIRMSGLFVLSPVLGRANIPVQARVAVSFMLSLVIFPMVSVSGVIPYSGLLSFALDCVFELLAGLVLGYLTTVFFAAVFIGGQMIDMQIGLGMVQVFDVQANIQVPIVGSLLNLILLEVFILADGHVRLIQIMFELFSYVPPGEVQFGQGIALAVAAAFIRAFVLGVSIAIPFVAAGLLSEVALGILVRIAPQLNIFVIGIPLKTLLGLIMLLMTLPVFVYFTSTLFDEMWEYIGRILVFLKE